MFQKVIKHLRDRGLFLTLLKILTYPVNKLIYLRAQNKISSLGNPEERFGYIYKNNIWGSSESKSGEGSSREHTENIRTHLPILIKKYGIKTFLDAPCGDLNWMKEVISENSFNYIGADVVGELIDELNLNYHDLNNCQFARLDITRDPLPRADIIMVRDCLFHLSNQEIFRFLDNYYSSEIPYLLTTSHHNSGFKNSDINTGDFRLLDLFNEPFNFPKNYLDSIEDWIEPYPKRSLFLWSKKDLVKSKTFEKE